MLDWKSKDPDPDPDLLCETQLPSKALFFFPEENMTGIGPTKIIVDNEKAAVGQVVTVKWQGKRVKGQIIVLSGKYLFYMSIW